MHYQPYQSRSKRFNEKHYTFLKKLRLLVQDETTPLWHFRLAGQVKMYQFLRSGLSFMSISVTSLAHKNKILALPSH